MKAIRVKTKCGDEWTTSINGTHEEIRAYYVGQWFNIGRGEHDHMVQVESIRFLGPGEAIGLMLSDMPGY